MRTTRPLNGFIPSRHPFSFILKSFTPKAWCVTTFILLFLLLCLTLILCCHFSLLASVWHCCEFASRRFSKYADVDQLAAHYRFFRLIMHHLRPPFSTFWLLQNRNDFKTYSFPPFMLHFVSGHLKYYTMDINKAVGLF